jgi:multimeric flavodoxin WrbA
MATVLLVMDGRAKDGSTQPELLPLAHAVSRGVTHTGAQVRLFGLSDSTESAAALASSDIKELPRDPDALQELCAGVEAVIIGGVVRRGGMSGTVLSALETLAALPTTSIAGSGPLSGKVGSVFTCSMGSGVGGHETALAAVHSTLISCGMLVCGVLPSPQLELLDAATPLGVCMPSGAKKEQRVAACRCAEMQGQNVADVAAKLQLASVVAQLRS